MASAGGRDLRALHDSLIHLPPLLERLAGVQASLLQSLTVAIDPLDDICQLVARGIIETPPFSLREGGIIAPGYNAELDELRAISSEGKGFIARLEAQERARTGISTLKIRYNRVFGYSIEITKSNLANVPADYIRRQTLANAERYITEELKNYEEKVLGAEERICDAGIHPVPGDSRTGGRPGRADLPVPPTVWRFWMCCISLANRGR